MYVFGHAEIDYAARPAPPAWNGTPTLVPRTVQWPDLELPNCHLCPGAAASSRRALTGQHGRHACRPSGQAIVLRSAPTPVTSTLITSPDFRYSGGVRRCPTPDGGPVRIRSPVRSSVNSLIVAMSRGIGKISRARQAGPRQGLHQGARHCDDPPARLMIRPP
jgi:hypothetical protein